MYKFSPPLCLEAAYENLIQTRCLLLKQKQMSHPTPPPILHPHPNNPTLPIPHRKYLPRFVIFGKLVSKLKITEGYNSFEENKWLWLSFSAHHQIKFNMCTKFHENTFDSFNGIEGTGFPYKRGYNCHLQRLQKLQRGIIPLEM